MKITVESFTILPNSIIPISESGILFRAPTMEYVVAPVSPTHQREARERKNPTEPENTTATQKEGQDIYSAPIAEGISPMTNDSRRDKGTAMALL